MRVHVPRLVLAAALTVGLLFDAIGEAATTAFVNVRVVSMNSDDRQRARQRQTAVVAKARIVEIGPEVFQRITGTYNPAVFFEAIDEVGTVEEGKRADLNDRLEELAARWAD